jgi:hypothetical protein
MTTFVLLFLGNDPEVPVTAYTAIYHQDGGYEVPAAVAGFKLPLHKLQQHMLTISESLAAPSVRTTIYLALNTFLLHNNNNYIKIFVNIKTVNNIYEFVIINFSVSIALGIMTRADAPLKILPAIFWTQMATWSYLKSLTTQEDFSVTLPQTPWLRSRKSVPIEKWLCMITRLCASLKLKSALAQRNYF